MTDQTETIRRSLVNQVNAEVVSTPTEDARASLQNKYGQVWDTFELQHDFTVQAFLTPFVAVRRKSDGVKGTLMFSHSPRFYFDFTPE